MDAALQPDIRIFDDYSPSIRAFHGDFFDRTGIFREADPPMAPQTMK
jgi:hypothetical protein